MTFEPTYRPGPAECVRNLIDEPISRSGFWKKRQLLRRVPFFSSHTLHPSLTISSSKMHAARIVRPIRAANRKFSRSLATATATTTRVHDTVIPLSNVEAQWEKMTADEQLTVHQQLEDLQKRDWRTLSLDEKKAGTHIRPLLEALPLPPSHGRRGIYVPDPILVMCSILRRLWTSRTPCPSSPPR